MKRTFGAFAIACAAATAAALPAGASATTAAVTVYAGPPPSAKAIAGHIVGRAFAQKYNPDVNDFFLHSVTVHQGDTVKFVINGFHTVDLPGRSGADQPLLLPGATVTGVDDAGGSPFWFDGHVPSIGLNPALFAPTGPHTYNGTTRIDSGLPLSPNAKPLQVTFTKPGTYKFFCDVHRGMVGYVVVKPTGKPVPSAAQNAAALKAQVTTDVESAKALAKITQPADHVSLGESNSRGVELYAMFPSTLTVNAGSVVTFSISKNSREVHTASFGPQAYLAKLANGFNGAVFPPAGVYPSDIPALGPIPESLTEHGNGFANIGVVDQDPTTTTIPSSGQIKFSQPGTYHFICLIHPFMTGTIIVR